MGYETKGQWWDSSVNPTMGCDGCELWNDKEKTCYAGTLHLRFGGLKGWANTFEEVTKFPGRMKKAAAWDDLYGKKRKEKHWYDGLPRIIFISDMSDALSKSIDFDYLKTEIIDNVSSEAGMRHIWMWLTKVPQRMVQFCTWLQTKGQEWPINLWPGTSITTQGTTSRVDHLLLVGHEDTTRFVSLEPQRGPVDLDKYLKDQIHMVIQGGESEQADDHTHPFAVVEHQQRA